MAGRTGVPERESFRSLAAHHATMAVFLSTGLLSQMEKELAEAGYEPDSPAAIIYKATWPEEKIVRSAPPSSTRPVFMEQFFLSVYS